jgi:hypothetical protein
VREGIWIKVHQYVNFATSQKRLPAGRVLTMPNSAEELLPKRSTNTLRHVHGFAIIQKRLPHLELPKSRQSADILSAEIPTMSHAVSIAEVKYQGRCRPAKA